jgi:hypothetical protein
MALAVVRNEIMHVHLGGKNEPKSLEVIDD